MARGAKTGGRKKGTGNKTTLKRKADIAASGLSPLDFMLSVMRDVSQETTTRMDAAKAAASYVHPKLAQVAHTGKDGDALKIEESGPPLEAVRRFLFLLAEAEKLS